MDAKQTAGEKAAEYVHDGMTIGLGTGSTVYWTIVKLGERVEKGLRIGAVATSRQTEKLAMQLGIPLLPMSDIKGKLDLVIDGADEISPGGNLIKGGGGALLREKLIASFSNRFIVVADDAKCVSVLGRFPLPVEVVPFGWQITCRQIEALGCKAELRKKQDMPFVTDNGNYILDCRFSAIHDPATLGVSLNAIPGAVENGLFVGRTDTVIIGHSDGTVKTNMFRTTN